MTSFRYRNFIKGAMLISALALCGFQTVLWSVTVPAVFVMLFTDPLNALMHNGFWIIFVAGGYGLGALGMMTAMFEHYAKYGVPLYVRIGVTFGVILAIYMLFDTVQKSPTIWQLFFPMGPLIHLLMCLILIRWCRARLAPSHNAKEDMHSSKISELEP